jgi:DNA-binding MarR family transcriptional regulator
VSITQSEVSTQTLARQLSELLPAMHFLLRPGGRERGHEAPSPEIRGQFRMMKTLHHAGQLTMQDLAEAMHVSPPTVTGIVKRGVAQGIVVRTPDPADGRSVQVALTEAGRAEMAVRVEAHVATLGGLLAALDDTDQRAIGEALPALERLLDVARATRDAPKTRGKSNGRGCGSGGVREGDR